VGYDETADVVETSVAPGTSAELKPPVLSETGVILLGATGDAIPEHPTLKVNSATPIVPDQKFFVILFLLPYRERSSMRVNEPPAWQPLRDAPWS